MPELGLRLSIGEVDADSIIGPPEQGLGTSTLTASLNADLETVSLVASSVSGATSYKFERDDNSGFSSPTTLQNTSSNTFTDSPTPGTVYHYRVVVTDGTDSTTSLAQSVNVTGIFVSPGGVSVGIQVFDLQATFIKKTYAPNYTIVHAKDTDNICVYNGTQWATFNND